MAEALAPKAAPAKHHSSAVALIWDGRVLLGILIGLYALHAWVRLTFTSAVEVDHAEQWVLAQEWQGLYGLRQPPLYTWLLLGLEQVFGPQRANAVLLKYACFIGAWVCYWRAARELGADPRLAGLSVLALAWLYQILWKLHHGITHTALLTLACCATLWLVARLRERQRPRDYLALGLAVAIGILSKHGYWAFLIGIVLASGSEARLCRAWRKPQVVWMLLPVLLLAGPYLYALLQTQQTLAAEYTNTLKVGSPDLSLGHGLQSLALAVLGFLSPFCVLALSTALSAAQKVATPRPAASWGERLLWRLSALLLCTLMLMLLGGARGFVERWLHPFLLWLPLALVLWSARRGLLAPGSSMSRMLIGGAIALLGASLAYQTAQDVLGPPWCGKCRPLLDYRKLADALRDQGLEQANVVAADEHIAANLRIALPGIRVAVPRYTQLEPRHRPDQACALIWPRDAGGDAPLGLLDFAHDWCGVGTPPAGPQWIGETLGAWQQRYPAWQRHLPPPWESTAYGWAYVFWPPSRAPDRSRP